MRSSDDRFEALAEVNPESLLADGFEEAYLGYTSMSLVAVYSRKKCIEILMSRDGMTQEEAEEYFSFNTEGAYVGEFTPIYLEEFEIAAP